MFLGVYEIVFLGVYEIVFLGVYEIVFLGVYEIVFLGVYEIVFLGVYEIVFLGNPLLKSEPCLLKLPSSLSDPLNQVPVRLNDCMCAAEGLSLSVLFQLEDIKSRWHFLALWSPCRMNVQVEFADYDPAVSTIQNSLYHSNILSVLS